MSMKRRQWLKLGLGVCGAAALTPSMAAAKDLVWHERAMLGFGTTLWLRAGHGNVAQLDAALDAAIQALREVESEMSLFNPDSAVSRLNATGVWHKPGVHLRSVLTLSQHVARRSNGAFDISMQPLWTLWAQAQAQNTLPKAASVQAARRLVNWQAIELSQEAIRLNVKGMGISLNGIAQGYAADVVKSVLQAHGIAHAQIDAGETTLLGQAPGGKPWTLGVEDVALVKHRHVLPVLQADGRALATSSDAHTVFSADHVHHHILNPHTGYSPTHWASVTMLAPSCALADALTKVFFMQTPQQIHATAKAWGVDVLAQRKSGEWVTTAGVPLLQAV